MQLHVEDFKMTPPYHILSLVSHIPSLALHTSYPNPIPLYFGFQVCWPPDSQAIQLCPSALGLATSSLPASFPLHNSTSNSPKPFKSLLKCHLLTYLMCKISFPYTSHIHNPPSSAWIVGLQRGLSLSNLWYNLFIHYAYCLLLGYALPTPLAKMLAPRRQGSLFTNIFEAPRIFGG